MMYRDRKDAKVSERKRENNVGRERERERDEGKLNCRTNIAYFVGKYFVDFGGVDQTTL